MTGAAGAGGQDILIVEDDEAIVAGLALNLKLAGHRTTAARDGDEALGRVAGAATSTWSCSTSTCPGATGSRCCRRCALRTTWCR